MTCGNCARHVTEAIQNVPGIRSVALSLEKQNAAIQWKDDADQNADAVIAAIRKAGYDAEPMADESGGCHSCHSPAQSNWQPGLRLGIFVTAFLMTGEWVFGLMTAPWFQWVSFALAAVTQFFSGAPFYRGAWRQLKTGSFNMDTLVALGSTTAFGYSAWALLSGYGGHLYFMEAAAIITLISLGHSVEARVSEKAGVTLKSLMQLAPQTARRVQVQKPEVPTPPPTPAFSIKIKSTPPPAPAKPEPAPPAAVETEVPIANLQLDDLVALRPGDRVPVDGVVLEGASTVNESMLTGESMPVEKKTGQSLFAGTLNLTGRLVMRVTATGEATALAHIIDAVQRAQTSRAEIQRLGDRVSGVFVPIVVAVAVIAGLWWGLAPESAARVHETLAMFLWHSHVASGISAGFIIAAAVLIVACPCAMGLATPAAIMAAANAAARRGILIRDGVALEKAGNITAILFDKTGTLTTGQLEVVTFIAVDPTKGADPSAKPADNKQLLQATSKLASALARHSAHPTSQAIATFPADEFQMKDWREIPGAGIEAQVLAADGQWKAVRVGSVRWFTDSEVDLSAGKQFISDHTMQGATIVGMTIDHYLMGLFALRDTIKPHSAEVIQQLQRRGLKTFLVTGDNVATAMNLAKRVGISGKNVFAEIRPEQKATLVKALRSKGDRIAFVGDGINDAPALTQADLGIAVSRASDIAREAADIVLLKSEIDAVPEALELAHATLRTIKQNLFWAFFYNAIGIPLAALGFISPIFCAAAMGMSDLVVIGNALRLLRWKKN